MASSSRAAIAGILCLLAVPLTAAEPVRLTSDGRLKFSSAFCDQGQAIVYADFEKPELFRLQRLNLADGTVEALHPMAVASEFEPAFSADGRFFACMRLKGVLSISLIIHDVAAGSDAEVPPPPGFAGLRTPAVAPDGSRVVYSLADQGRQQLYSVDAQGGDRRMLTDSAGLNIWPCYSPDGKRIAFSSTRDGNYEIYLMDSDGGSPRRLTDSSLADLRPSFSPDGRRIAFVSHRDGNAEIYLMNSDGTGQQRLTDNPERDDYPAWQPDGRRLVIVSERDGRHDLYLLDVHIDDRSIP